MAVDDARDGERGEPDQPSSLSPAPRRSRGLPRLRGRRGGSAADPAGGSPEGTGNALESIDTGGTGETGGSARGRKVRAFFGVIADRIIETAPRVPVRDLETLRAQFPGLGPEELADKLVAGATRSSAAVGAGVGAVAMLPVPPAMPAELAAEIVGVASIELKLVAELHEVYGRRPPGGLKERTAAYLGAWTSERGIDIGRPTSLNAALGGQMKRELRQRIMKRTFRNLPNLAPFMVGATVGAVMNRRDTKKIADKVRADLRAHSVPWSALPAPEDRGAGGIGRGPRSLPPAPPTEG